MKQQEQIILGIDPGTLMMGFAIIHINAGKIKVLEMDVLKLSHNKNVYERKLKKFM